MSSLAPDPSLPNQMDARIRQIVFEVLSDTQGLPPGFVSWLSTFVSINQVQTGTPIQTTPPT